MVFQDPCGSLNPVRTIEQHVAFPLSKFRGAKGEVLDTQVSELLELVGLTPVRETRAKFPHELSGGQRQRVAIARALAAKPSILVADEPISMLDVSIRAGILRLMERLKNDFGLSYLYITHDLASAHYFGDRIMVLYGGKIMEIADSKELIRNPVHPYTRLLLAATPGAGHTVHCRRPAVRHQICLKDVEGVHLRTDVPEQHLYAEMRHLKFRWLPLDILLLVTIFCNG